MYLTLYTGGRAGTVVAFISFISSVIIYFSHKLNLFFNSKKTINKFFTIGSLFVFSLFFFFLSSNSS